MNVSAKDLGTGKEQKITITSSSGLSEDDIKRMVKEAEAHSEEDRKQKELAETRNQADALAYQAEKTLSDLGDKVPADRRDAVNAAVEELKRAAAGDAVQEIKDKTDALTKLLYDLSTQNIYSQQQDASGEGQQGSGSQGETVDAEFEEVDDKDGK